MNDRKSFVTACGLSLGTVVFGLFAAVLWGGEPPAWLLRAEVALFSAAALAYGFTASLPAFAPWAWSRPVRGAACIILGVGAIFVPVQFVVSAFLLGVGTRLTWTAACELEDEQNAPATILSVVIARSDIVTTPEPQPPARRPRTAPEFAETGTIVNHHNGACPKGGGSGDER
jgi:hypothetical protein